MPLNVVLDDPAYVRTLLFRLERAELTPGTISADERASVLREARLVIRGFSDERKAHD